MHKKLRRANTRKPTIIIISVEEWEVISFFLTKGKNEYDYFLVGNLKKAICKEMSSIH